MVKDIIEKDLITFEYPPDGGVVPIIDPYDGCTIRCHTVFKWMMKTGTKIYL